MFDSSQVFQYLINFLYILPVILISLTVHEYAHALAASRLGDPTPRDTGRLTLNPLHHIDPLGFIVMLLVHFGWAKPVQVNPLFFKNPRKGMMLTAIAGPISNLILCFISSIPYYFSIRYRWPVYFIIFFAYMVMLNIGLAVFNLIPIHPLDGSRVLSYFIPSYASFMAKYGGYIQIGFIVLLILPDFFGFPDVLGSVILFVQSKTSSILFSLWSVLFSIIP